MLPTMRRREPAEPKENAEITELKAEITKLKELLENKQDKGQNNNSELITLINDLKSELSELKAKQKPEPVNEPTV